jgi:membrane fusion protein, copper/silver efflux system
MFVDVEMPVQLPAAVTVPVDAVLDAGRRNIVYVDRGNGMFEPRPVETGWRFGDRIAITKGLDPGERIVVSGNFLIDSESRMKLTAATPVAAAKDPVCGMDVDPAKAGTLTGKYKGTTYYFCSDSCKRKFEAKPESYVSGDGHPGQKPS